MRMAMALAVLASACGGGHQRQCFECGLTDEWARAEREAQERAASDLRERTAAIERAVAEGEPPQADPHRGPSIIAEAFYDNEEPVLHALVASLEKSCVPQASLAVTWTYDWLAKNPPGADELSTLRRRAFTLLAASRGGAAAPELEGCPNTPLASLCDDSTSVAAEREKRCTTATGE